MCSARSSGDYTYDYDHHETSLTTNRRPVSLDISTINEVDMSANKSNTHNPRISISSSILPDSSDFHDHILYNDDDGGPDDPGGELDPDMNRGLDPVSGTQIQQVPPHRSKADVAVSREASRTLTKSVSPITSKNSNDRPPTVNTLAPKEREKLVRQNRKLAHIFGAEPTIANLTPLKGHQRVLSDTSYYNRAPKLTSSGGQGDGRHQVVVADEPRNVDFLDLDDDEDWLIGSVSLPPSPVSEFELARRQKRARIAKLHRCLGSGVPAELVLGITEHTKDMDLPRAKDDTHLNNQSTTGKWLGIGKGRRSSLSSETSPWEDSEGSRMKDELSDKEKAANVKRALKMERVFGDKPPQALYHTRSPVDVLESSRKQNPNQSAYMKPAIRRAWTGASRRPGTAESSDSSRHLLGVEGEVFKRYRDSLNSLSEIVDRDDKHSIATLHRILSAPSEEEVGESSSAGQARSPSPSSPSIKSERRRSLPITRKDSLLSLSSYNVVSPSPEQTTFQVRRKRAAKLASFFGVDYRELFDDVIAAFELDIVEETGRGSLKPDESQVLLDKLRRLKAKNNSSFKS